MPQTGTGFPWRHRVIDLKSPMAPPTTLRVLIAPDKFKGTLSAQSAAEAMEAGVRAAAAARSVPVEIDRCPIADGGEGTAEIIASTWKMKPVRGVLQTTGPMGEEVEAPFWCDPTAGEAAFDSAAACGLALVPPSERNPARCSTLGVGNALKIAAKHARVVTIGLGGSATVDGGVGLAAALGWRFEDQLGRAFNTPTGAALPHVARVIPPPPDSSMRASLLALRVRVLCDVTTPLLGAHGCAALYAPQKGATPAMVRELDDGLRHLVELTGVEPIERDGAAGGLAYGLRAFVAPLVEHLTLESGAEAVLRAVRLADRAATADLIITGEGRYDATSIAGKAVGEVIALARQVSKPVLVVAGSIGPEAVATAGVTLAQCAGHGLPMNEEEAADRLRRAAADALHRWLDARGATA